MIEIELSQGKVAIIDDEDFDIVKGYKWHFHNKRYAATNVKFENGKVRPVTMHRMIMGFPDSKFETDHINRNGLDNRRENLRVVTVSENQRNRKLLKVNTSGHAGVGFDKQKKKWVANITVNNEFIYLGSYDKKEDAISARKSAEKKHGFVTAILS